MKMIKRVLIGLAGTTYTPVAIQRAITVAQSHDAEVTGVTVLDRGRVRCEGIGLLKAAGRELIRAERMEIARSQIEQSVHDLETACQTADIKYRIVEESGDAFTALIDLARCHDLMVFGLRSVFEYDFLGCDPGELLLHAGVSPIYVSNDAYLEDGAQFRDAIERIIKAANEDDYEAAAVAHDALTASCIDCHRRVLNDRGRAP